MEVETGDGTVRRVDEAGLPAVLRAALDAGQAIRRVQPVPGASAGLPGGTSWPAARPAAARPAPRRAGAARRVLHGAVHRARLLTSSQWFLAPAMLFLVVLGDRLRDRRRSPAAGRGGHRDHPGAPDDLAGVLAQRVDGRELARAFAAHVGGRARAHLAADLGLAPFAVLLSLAALVAPLISQGEHPHPALLDGKIVLLHLAAAVLGAGIGSLLALIERAGWRLLAAVAVYLVLFVVRGTPMTPLLRLSTHPATLATPVGGPAALALPAGRGPDGGGRAAGRPAYLGVGPALRS